MLVMSAYTKQMDDPERTSMLMMDAYTKQMDNHARFEKRKYVFVMA